jgi:hypothetical protein
MNAPSSAGEPNKPITNHGFATKETGKEHICGRANATTTGKKIENINVRIMLKHDIPNDTSPGCPPISSDVPHIRSD